MKKVLGFAMLMALFATSALAVNSPQRVQGLRFGTWTPTGFEASSDTTFINGATQTADTTEAFNASFMDWGANTLDPNGIAPVLRLWVAGDFISTDTVRVIVHQSFDKKYWWVASSTVNAGNQSQGTQQAFGIPFTYQASLGVITAPASNALIAAPYIRFSIAGDGNTAARMSGTRAWVAYDDVRDNPNEQPMLVVRKVRWGTHTPQGFSVEKDTSSVTFAVVDTSETFSLQEWSKGPTGQNPTVSDSLSALGTLCGIFEDVSGTDSVYIQQQVSPNGFHFSSPRLAPDNQYGMFSGVVTATLPVDLDNASAGGFLVNVGGSHVTTGSRPNGLSLAPFVRFTVRSSNDGEAMGSLQCWLTYWRIPRK